MIAETSLSLEMYIATGIFIISYVMIFTEILHRTSAAVIGAVIMVGMGSLFEFYSQQDAVMALDVNTLFLLLAMMMLVAMLRPTGGFEYLAIRLAKFSKGDPRKLLIYISFIVSLLSMFLDNVTMVLIFAPLIVLITRILALNLAPFLIAMTMLSNIGGATTLVGDPPNIMIASSAGLDFTTFLINMGPIILPAWIGTVILILFLFRKELQVDKANQQHIDLDESKAIKDSTTLLRVGLSLFTVIILFFIHHRLHFFPAYVAWIGVALALLLSRPKPEKLFINVEWSVLLFFASLFVIVGGVQASGLLDLIGNTLAVNTKNPEAILYGALLIMWGSAFLTALIGNIPFTITMVPIIAGLDTQGINVMPLWWALAIGVGLGGNATHIGSAANIICIAEAEKSGHPNSLISPVQWLRIGAPVTLLSLSIASAVFIVLFEWISH